MAESDIRPVSQRPPTLGPRPSRVKLLAWRLIAVAVVLLIWQLTLPPRPADVIDALIEATVNGRLPGAAAMTLVTSLIGLALGVTLALILGLSLGVVRALGSAFGGASRVLIAIPLIALLPVLLIWIGETASKLVIVALAAAAPEWRAVYNRVMDARGDLIEMARASGHGEVSVFRLVMVPDAMIALLARLPRAAAAAFAMTLAIELLTGVALGGWLGDGSELGRGPDVIAGAIFAFAVGIALHAGLRQLVRPFAERT